MAGKGPLQGLLRPVQLLGHALPDHLLPRKEPHLFKELHVGAVADDHLRPFQGLPGPLGKARKVPGAHAHQKEFSHALTSYSGV